MVELRIDTGYDGYGKDGNGASIVSITWESDAEKRWKDADADKYKEVAREVCDWVLNVRLHLSTAESDKTTLDVATTLTVESLTAAVADIPSFTGKTYSHRGAYLE